MLLAFRRQRPGTMKEKLEYTRETNLIVNANAARVEKKSVLNKELIQGRFMEAISIYSLGPGLRMNVKYYLPGLKVEQTEPRNVPWSTCVVTEPRGQRAPHDLCIPSPYIGLICHLTKENRPPSHYNIGICKRVHKRLISQSKDKYDNQEVMKI